VVANEPDVARYTECTETSYAVAVEVCEQFHGRGRRGSATELAQGAKVYAPLAAVPVRRHPRHDRRSEVTENMRVASAQAGR
jgi:hypothetical protein